MSDSSNDAKDTYNHGGLIAFVFSMAFCFLFFIYVSFIHQGVDLKEGLTVPAADSGQTVAAVDVSKVTEPWVSNPDMVAHGKKLYAQNCAMCHGNEGKGDGAAGAGLTPKPRNLQEGPWKKGGGYVGLFHAITDGIEGGSMASYKHLKSVDRWALVQFVDSITKAKVKEDAAKVAAFAKTAQ